LIRFLAPLALVLATGCASLSDADPRDPFEGVNRKVYNFNDQVDGWVLRPVATAYRSWIPGEIRDRVRNFFSNIADPMIGVNNMLQGKFEDGFLDLMRFSFNTTIGLLGIHDVASEMGYEKHNEDFGQTFGHWGAGTGPYLILPLLGSSNVRDGLGLVPDFYLDPLGELRPYRLQYALWGTRLVNTRADLLDASRLLEEAALDRYVFQRDAYLQRRRSLVYDGRPPRERDPEAEPPGSTPPAK
jgi:phospholipid-binding lipoprotein MlaA